MTAILTLIYCWLQEFFFSHRIGASASGIPALRGGQHARHHWDGRAHPAGDSRSICVGAGRDGHESGAGHRGERHGDAVHLQTIPFVRWGS